MKQAQAVSRHHQAGHHQAGSTGDVDRPVPGVRTLAVRSRWTLLFAVGFALILSAAGAVVGDEPAGQDAAVERARKQVRMLDDIYKISIVLVTDHYVKEDSDLPAGAAFKKLFAAVKEKGWHEVRLLDATGEPLEDVNSPKPGFEQRAVKQLKSGKPYYDELQEQDGKRYLLAATPIPVVMQKCVLCHENYSDVPKGHPIGALGYKIPVE